MKFVESASFRYLENKLKKYFFINFAFYLTEPLGNFLLKFTELLGNVLNSFFEFLIKTILFNLNILEHLIKTSLVWRLCVFLLELLHVKFQWTYCVFLMFFLLSAKRADKAVLMT